MCFRTGADGTAGSTTATSTSKFNLWWGTNADSYSFTLDGQVVGEGSLVVASPGAQVGIVQLTGVPAGEHALVATSPEPHGRAVLQDTEPLASRQSLIRESCDGDFEGWGEALSRKVSPFMVKTHAVRAMAKVEERDRAQLVTFTFRAGLYP